MMENPSAASESVGRGSDSGSLLSGPGSPPHLDTVRRSVDHYGKGAMSDCDFKATVFQAREGNHDEIIATDFYRENVLQYKAAGRNLEIRAGLGFQT
jgi:hypothetical protein